MYKDLQQILVDIYKWLDDQWQNTEQMVDSYKGRYILSFCKLMK